MAVVRARSFLLAAGLLAIVGVLALQWSAQAFVSAPRAQVEAVALRGAPAAAIALAAASMPLAATAEVVRDEFVDYNFAGEATPYMIGGYFLVTGAATGFAFFSYLILTKLKII
ncbi:unnamed protein product [Polarella glacialis]|uniref:Uncharacterized protein n=1 Tax=Polarella glacialis TaxID=89957 RepID=A0A813KTW5_POLGL|nr:unnamed protein product [Polarella glacialis]